MADGYASKGFQAVRVALLDCNDADRAYMRRWILRGIDAPLGQARDPQPPTNQYERGSPLERLGGGNLLVADRGSFIGDFGNLCIFSILAPSRLHRTPELDQASRCFCHVRTFVDEWR